MTNPLNYTGLFLCLFALTLLSACGETSSDEKASLPYYNDASFTPNWYATRSEVPASFHKIPSFKLQDQQGQAITEDTFKDKLYIANFFFTECPGICPMTMSNMARLQEALAHEDDVVLLSHSVTPEKDSVEVLAAFAQKMQSLSSKWYLVTGERDQMYELGKHAYFAEEDLGEIALDDASRDEAFLHTESFFLLDQDRHIRGVYNGMNTAAVTQLIEDVKRLQAERYRPATS